MADEAAAQELAEFIKQFDTLLWSCMPPSPSFSYASFLSCVQRVQLAHARHPTIAALLFKHCEQLLQASNTVLESRWLMWMLLVKLTQIKYRNPPPPPPPPSIDDSNDAPPTTTTASSSGMTAEQLLQQFEFEHGTAQQTATPASIALLSPLSQECLQLLSSKLYELVIQVAPRFLNANNIIAPLKLQLNVRDIQAHG